MTKVLHHTYFYKQIIRFYIKYYFVWETSYMFNYYQSLKWLETLIFCPGAKKLFSSMITILVHTPYA